MNDKFLCVFDLETDSTDPETANIIQIASIMIDPTNLTISLKDKFESCVKPPDIDDVDYYDKHKSTIEWHAKNLGVTSQDLLERWKTFPEEKIVWISFKNYLDLYHSKTKRKSRFSAPIAAGMNIYSFDLPIMNRIAKKYGDYDEKQQSIKLFYPRDKIDLMNIFFLWFENTPEINSYSMDKMRQYFGISTEGSHEAMKDVIDTADLIRRFLYIHRSVGQNITFKGAIKNNPKPIQ